MESSEAQRTEKQQATPLVYGYVGSLLSLNLAPAYLAGTAVYFVARKHLHLDDTQTSAFKTLVSCPILLAFGFGMIRDRFNPLKLGDRGFILVAGLVAAALYAALGAFPLGLVGLGAGLIFVSVSLELVRAAYQAIMRNVSEVRLMSGRMSTTYQFLHNGVPALGMLAAGWISHHFSWRPLFFVAALGYLCFALFGLWRPAEVFDGLPTSGDSSFAKLWSDLKELKRHKAVWIAAVIWGLWAFSPGANTALSFYLQGPLKLSDWELTVYGALFTGLCLPGILLFGVLCKRISLWTLLIIATVVGIPSMLPLMFIHTTNQAYIAGSVMALAGGLANAAYWVIVIRACPKELAGTGMLIAISFGWISWQGSDNLGSWMVHRWGFSSCAIVTTVGYLFLIPLLLMLPRSLVRPHDDEVIGL